MSICLFQYYLPNPIILYRPITTKRVDPAYNGTLHFVTPPVEISSAPTPCNAQFKPPVDHLPPQSSPKNTCCNIVQNSPPINSSPNIVPVNKHSRKKLSTKLPVKQHTFSSTESASSREVLGTKNNNFQKTKKIPVKPNVNIDCSNKENMHGVKPRTPKCDSFLCSVCGIRYKHYSSLYKHNKSFHQTSTTKPGPIKCMESACSFSCTRINYLQKHLSTVHNQEFHHETKKFQCMKGML